MMDKPDAESRPDRPVWRSLDEYRNAWSFKRQVEREFPPHATEWPGGLSRRRFLQLMGASLAMTGMAGCVKQPPRAIVPYINQPEELTPGELLQYATAMEMNGVASGILATSAEGRPIKIEGNPRHPANAGGTDAFMQASILSLYDPERAQAVKHFGSISSWDIFQSEVIDGLARARSKGGAGWRILTGAVTSPTMLDQLQTFLRAYPEARWHAYEPISRDHSRAGTMLAFGQPVRPLYRFDLADVVLSLDADFLQLDPNRLLYSREFAERRRVRAAGDKMNRLYVAESMLSITGATADHRLALRPGEIELLAFAVARALENEGLPSAIGTAAGVLRPDYFQWAQRVARDLRAHAGGCIVIAGEPQPPVVHALAHLMNDALGNHGRTVNYLPEMEAISAGHVESIAALTHDMRAGQVDTLLVIDANPVYTAPAVLDFAEALDKVWLCVQLGEYEDETSARCRNLRDYWFLPKSHYLESWGDTRASDGTVALQQPLIQPLFPSHSALEVMALLNVQSVQAGYDLVREYWRGRMKAPDFEAAWTNALNNGVVDNTALAPLPVQPQHDFAAQLATTANAQGATQNNSGSLDICFLPDPSIWDGRFANNAWLQELPKPLTRLTWDNAALMSPATAAKHGLDTNDLVTLTLNKRAVTAPVLILPGHADGCVTVHLGYGRTAAGSVGNKAGFNAYALRTAEAQWFASGLTVTPTGKQARLATTHGHHTTEGRPVIHANTIGDFRRNPHRSREGGSNNEAGKGRNDEQEPTLYPAYPNPVNAWAMVIDNNVCIGCNACVVACQSENNIPVVGKAGVLREREMHWIRIDTYFQGEPQAPEVFFEPVPCMQCEKAPCEVVCPVGATVHSDDGLNEMIYNRCVGTRYCSNNCPYKVRRFNFFNNTIITDPLAKMVMNPDVTVRSRGVMEKCTYCVQRIQRVKIEAEKSDRKIRDGEVRTACQMACPTLAIHFGDLNDPGSDVTKLRQEPHEFSLLAELNTRPRTTYLSTFKNPNPEMQTGKTP